jgi:hypothetical protein
LRWARGRRLCRRRIDLHGGGSGLGRGDTLLEPVDALLLLVARPREVGCKRAQLIPILLRQAEDVGHLPLERIEPLVERGDRRLGRRRFVGEASRVGRAAAREDLPLNLLELPLEPVDPLLGRWRLALGLRRLDGKQDGGRAERQAGDCTQGFHE